MRNLMIAAAGFRGEPWRKHLKIDIGIEGNQVTNKVTGEVAVLPSGLTFSDDGNDRVAVFTSAQTGGIQLAHDAGFAPRTGDFTIELIADVDSIWNEPADQSQIIPFTFWGTWAAPDQVYVLDSFYNVKNGDFQYIGNRMPGPVDSTANSGYIVPVLDRTKYVHHVIQRRDNVISFYRDGVLLRSTGISADIKAPSPSTFRIMSRRGGGSGNVWWRFIGKLKGFRFTHAAIYPEQSFIPPSRF